MRIPPSEIWIERGEEGSTVARTAVERLPQVPTRFFTADAPPPAVDFDLGKKSLVLKRHRGGFLEHCPAGTSGYGLLQLSGRQLREQLSLRLLVLLPAGLSRRAIRGLTAFTNVESGLEEIDRALSSHPAQAVPDRHRRARRQPGARSGDRARVALLVPFFAARGNAVLELKTKSDCIEELLGLDPRGRTVVSWSLSPETVVAEEYGTAPLAARLVAAARVRAAGYQVGFHLDPIVEHEGWESAYGRLLDDAFDAVEPGSIAWFSLGSLRMTPALQRKVRARPAATPALRVQGAELVPGEDGKLRVWRGLRVRMYRFLVERIRAVAPDTPLYLCMEGPGIWQQAMREVPTDRELGVRVAAGARW